MTLCQDAVKLAAANGNWQKHPNRKWKDQEIQLVRGLARYGKAAGRRKTSPSMLESDKYFVFMTTDTDRIARQIINTYELRLEIEEAFRQMKDFWRLKDFKSTMHNYFAYHIVMTLVEYL